MYILYDLSLSYSNPSKHCFYDIKVDCPIKEVGSGVLGSTIFPRYLVDFDICSVIPLFKGSSATTERIYFNLIDTFKMEAGGVCRRRKKFDGFHAK